jgi:amino acid adenylation domain-containing protein
MNKIAGSARLESSSLPPRLNAVADAVSAQAAVRPLAGAVVCGASVLTYQELEQRSNQMARQLIDLGVGSETIVAICLERSFESIISALAVLKAGGAYLPIDPKLPIERFNFYIRDARPRVLITASHAAGDSYSCSVKLLNLGAGVGDTGAYPGDRSANATSEQLAYVIYTSGSTGQAKGVEITLGNLLNLISWHQAEFQINADDRATHLAGVGFDASVWEIWPYLTAGATLYIPDEATRMSPEVLCDWIIQNQITISFLPTPLAESLIEMEWPKRTALRCLLTGADTLRRRPTKQLPFDFVNNYGPTECTVVATSGRVRSCAGSALPTIGRPIANTRIYLLDDNLCEVAEGEIGEIFIGGANVGRGYLRRPELTGERFTCDPFSDDPNARMYRTGDLARRCGDQDMAYVGRIDEQIKIHGYRIEPAEIEAVLDRHRAILSSVVVARPSDCADGRLIAYLRLRRNELRPTASELRDFLKSSLPEYMVPTLFVNIETLPLTSNGKIDRKSLPDPNDRNRIGDDEFRAARTPTQQKVAEILCALFKVREVDFNDNFFLLGGHSLLGAQLVTRIRGAFGIELPLRTIFDAPTITALAGTIEREIVARVESITDAETKALVA